jgi:hypothetical protein
VIGTGHHRLSIGMPSRCRRVTAAGPPHGRAKVGNPPTAIIRLDNVSIFEGLATRVAAIETRADAADEDRRLAEARADAAMSRSLAGGCRSAGARADAERATAASMGLTD